MYFVKQVGRNFSNYLEKVSFPFKVNKISKTATRPRCYVKFIIHHLFMSVDKQSVHQVFCYMS